MNENYDKIKEFIVENKYEILLTFIILGSLIVFFTRNSSNSSNSSNNNLNDKQKKFLRTLTDMADILKKNNILYFLSSGTALGCHREKRFIEHDEDIDLGVFENVSFTNILNIVNNSDKFVLKYSWPRNTKIENATELSFIHKETRVKIDIFKFYKIKDKYMSMAYAGNCDNKPRKRCEWLDPINLIKMDFMGKIYNVPDISFIISHYGNDWNIPKIESYDNQKSIIN
jgi:hypothetical protein